MGAIAVVCVVALVAGSAGAEPPSGRGDPQAQSGDSTRRDDSGRLDATRQRPSQRDVDELSARARRDGSVRVIVGLRMVFEPEGDLNASRAGSQRSAISREREFLYRDLRGTGSRELRSYDTIPFVAVELSEEGVEALRASEHAASVTVDGRVKPTLAQSAPLVQAPELWSQGHEGSGVLVAILDTGVQSAHPFFGGRVVEEACYSTTSGNTQSLCPGGVSESTAAGSGEDCDPNVIDGCGHGTHVAGIAAGSGMSFHGVARDADIMAVQVFSRLNSAFECDPDPSPCVTAFFSDLMKGLERVFSLKDAHTIAAVNMSLGDGSPNATACDAHPMKTVIDNLRSARIATVIASGNEGFTGAVSFPACISTAVTVGATRKNDGDSLFGNIHATLVDLYAPGVNINSSVPVGTGPGGTDFAAFSGTSMAAPHVAGAFALIRDKHPDAAVSGSGVLGALQLTGEPLTFAPGITTPRIRIFQAAVGCDDVLTAGVWAIPADLDCADDGPGVGGPNVTLHLSDHAVLGSGIGCGVCTVSGANARGFLLRGGTVQGFDNNVNVSGTGRIRILGVTVLDAARRGVRVIAERSVVRDSVSDGNGTQGILVRATNRAVLLNNTVADNGRQGILIRSDVANVRRNEAIDNGRFGIQAPNKPGIRGNNTATGNNSGGRQCRPPRLCSPP